MYYRTDEEVEAFRALQMVADLSYRVADDIYQWRWILISLHAATQAFMVLSLRCASPYAPLEPENALAWRRALESGEAPPDQRLDRYPNLYKKVRGKVKGTLGYNQPFVPTPTQHKNIRRLNIFRNRFIHFPPQGWSLEVNGLPAICLDNLALIAFLGWTSGNVRWNEETRMELSQISHLQIGGQMNTLAAIYEAQK